MDTVRNASIYKPLPGYSGLRRMGHSSFGSPSGKSLLDRTLTKCPHCGGPAIVDECESYSPGGLPVTKRIVRCDTLRRKDLRCPNTVEIIEKEPVMPTPSPELIERYKALGAEKSYRVARLTGMTAHRVQIACSPASVSGKSTLESIDRAITKIEKAEAALGEVAKVTFSDPQPVSTAAAAPFTEDQVKLLDALKEQNHQEGHSCLTCGAPLDKDADHDIEQVFNWNVPGFYVQPLRFPVRFPNCRDQSKTGSVRPVSFWHGDPSTEEAQLIRVCLLDANPGMTVTVNTPDYPIMPNKLETWLGVTGIESWDHLRRKS